MRESKKRIEPTFNPLDPQSKKHQSKNDKLLMQSFSEFSNLNEKPKGDVATVLSTLREFIKTTDPSEDISKKILSVDGYLRSRIKRQKEEVLYFDEYSMQTLRNLRNNILHSNRKIDSFNLLDLGSWLWKRIGRVYSNDPIGLYNLLSFLFGEKNPEYLEKDSVSITDYYKHFYDCMEKDAKAKLIQNLILMTYDQFKLDSDVVK